MLTGRSTARARTLVDELVRLGLRMAFVGSGARSAPLVEALVRHPRIRVEPHVDERSAAFWALGAAATSGEPAAVVTTSGTAASNLFPAVIEASQTGIPLVALTADRPARLRGTDANQTVWQRDLFGPYPRLALDLEPLDVDEEPETLRAAARRAWSACLGTREPGGPRELRPGPVHLNVQFEKPLEPARARAVPTHVRAGPGQGRGAPGNRRSGKAGARLAQLAADAVRPLVIAGPAVDPGLGRAALELGRALGCPVVADVLSGARFCPGASDSVAGLAPAFLSSRAVRRALAPDLVIRTGAAPPTRSVATFVKEHAGANHVRVVFPDGPTDHLVPGSERIEGDPADVLREAASRVRAAPGEPAHAGTGAFKAGWDGAERAAAAVIQDQLGKVCFEGSVAAVIARLLPPNGLWLVGNSMPVRDVDTFVPAHDKPIRAIGFRGASGIDGFVSACMGAGLTAGVFGRSAREISGGGSSIPPVALMGDLTFLHDAGALMVNRPSDLRLHIVVVQNRGGTIFRGLPLHAFDPPFTRHIEMPQEADLGKIAAAARLPFRRANSLSELEAALRQSATTPGPVVTEVVADPDASWRTRRALMREAAAAAGRALGLGAVSATPGD